MTAASFFTALAFVALMFGVWIMVQILRYGGDQPNEPRMEEEGR